MAGSGGAVASGLIANANYNDNSTNTETTTTNQDTQATIGGSSYAAQIELGTGASGNSITSTTTDFGAVAAASGIAQSAIASQAQGFGLLTTLTGSALNKAAEAQAAAATPFSQTIAKYATIIVSVIAGAIVLGSFFFFRRRHD